MTSTAHEDQAAPPIARLRIVTDIGISQIPWWSERILVLAPPTGRGIWASIEMAWKTLRHAAGAGVFISGNPRNALALGVFKRLTGRRRPILIMAEMRLDDPRPGWAWRLKLALQRFAYAAADMMCVSARREAEVYAARLNVPATRFQFVPWHTNVLQPRMCHATGEYVFAAGRTSRDWPTLAEAARDLPVPFVVVCTAADAAAVRFPSNVTVLTDVPYPRYRELLEAARIVSVPLESHVYSSGQVVILEAMALGKPVITSRVLGTEDYIIDGVDGVLVSPGNAAELHDAIHRVATVPGLSVALGQAALDRVKRLHTLDRYVRRLVAIAEDLSAAGLGELNGLDRA